LAAIYEQLPVSVRERRLTLTESTVDRKVLTGEQWYEEVDALFDRLPRKNQRSPRGISPDEWRECWTGRRCQAFLAEDLRTLEKNAPDQFMDLMTHTEERFGRVGLLSAFRS